MATPPRTAVQAALDLYDAVNRGDLVAMLALLRPNVHLISAARDASGAGIGQGRDGFEAWWSGATATGGRPRVFVREARDVAGRAVCEIAVTNEKDDLLDVATVVWAVITVDAQGQIESSWSYLAETDAVQAAATGVHAPAP
jgi:hypothetical protein